jgi:hypothetical protein
MAPNVGGGDFTVRSRNVYSRDQYAVPNTFHKKGKSLSYLYWNMESGFNVNRQDVYRMAEKDAPSVLILGNTNFSNQHPAENRSVPGYIGFHLPLADQKEGHNHNGLSLFLRQGLEGVQVQLNDPRLPILVVKVMEKDYLKPAGTVSYQDKVSLVCCVLGEDEDVLPDLLSNINTVLSAEPASTPKILIGTLEVYNADWIYEDGSPTTDQGIQLRSLVSNHDMVPRSRLPTWFPALEDGSVQEECVDLVICSSKLRCEVKHHELTGGSEHTPVLVEQERTYCTICKLGFNFTEELAVHYKGAGHLMSRLFYMYSRKKEVFMKNPNPLELAWELVDAEDGVEISKPAVIKILVDEHTKKKFRINLRNIGKKIGENEKGLVVESVQLLRQNACVQISDSVVRRDIETGLPITVPGVTATQKPQKIRILPSISHKFDVVCTGSEIGRHRIVLFISFYCENKSKHVPDPEDATVGTEQGRRLLDHMAIELDLRIINQQVRELGPSAPYIRPKSVFVWNVKETIPGLKVDYGGVDKLPRKVNLGDYKLTSERRIHSNKIKNIHILTYYYNIY